MHLLLDIIAGTDELDNTSSKEIKETDYLSEIETGVKGYENWSSKGVLWQKV